MQPQPIKRRYWQCSKATFLKAWPGGYAEDFSVYQPKSGLSEREVVESALEPFYDFSGSALEVGCGKGFWISSYLLPHFYSVIGVDVIPPQWVLQGLALPRFTYVELEENDYSLSMIPEGEIDFVWSFGVFCHLGLESIRQYLKSIFRVLKKGRYASLYFSDNVKRPHEEFTSLPDLDQVGWTDNDWPTTRKMMQDCGFTKITPILEHGKDLMLTALKP